MALNQCQINSIDKSVSSGSEAEIFHLYVAGLEGSLLLVKRIANFDSSKFQNTGTFFLK